MLRLANSESIHATLMRSQLRWAGYVHRMQDSRLPKKLLYGELSSGRRSSGRPKLRFKDTLKLSLKQCDIPHSTWERAAEERSAWRSAVQTGVSAFEKNRIRNKELKRQRRKDSDISDYRPDAVSQIPCPHCNRVFRAKIGLISHLRTHPRPPVI